MIKECICSQCEVAFTTHHKRKYCSIECRSKAMYLRRGGSGKTRVEIHQEAIERRTFNCKHCGKRHTATGLDRMQFCSKSCQARHFSAIRWEAYEPPPKYCQVALNQCKECGAQFTSRYKRGHCSDRCRHQYYSHERYKRNCEAINCINCGISFTTLHGVSDQCCSSECKAERAKQSAGCTRGTHTQRAKRYGVKYTRVDPFKVFNRDEWKCQACGCDTPRELRGTGNDDSPELDHVVALSQGGTHTYDNVQCLCRVCNLLKGTMPNDLFLQEWIGQGRVNSLEPSI